MKPGRPRDERPWKARATWRLAAAMAAAVVVLAMLAMGLQYRLVETRLTEGQRALLSADLDGFAALYDQRRIIALREAIDWRAAASGGTEMLLLQDRQGRVLAGTLEAWPEGLATSGQGFTVDPAQEVQRDGSRWLVVARELPGGFPLLVGRSLQPVDDTLAALRRGMLGLLAGVLAAAAVTGWLAANWVMRRIGRVNALADRVAAGDLAARLPGPRAPDEFGLLETHVHAMLDRIENLNRATPARPTAHRRAAPWTALPCRARSSGTAAAPPHPEIAPPLPSRPGAWPAAAHGRNRIASPAPPHTAPGSLLPSVPSCRACSSASPFILAKILRESGAAPRPLPPDQTPGISRPPAPTTNFRIPRRPAGSCSTRT